MSTETIAIVISAAGLLLSFLGALFGGAAWMIRRFDTQLERLEDRLGDRLTAVERELVEVKTELARLEGPPHRLVPAR